MEAATSILLYYEAKYKIGQLGKRARHKQAMQII